MPQTYSLQIGSAKIMDIPQIDPYIIRDRGLILPSLFPSIPRALRFCPS